MRAHVFAVRIRIRDHVSERERVVHARVFEHVEPEFAPVGSVQRQRERGCSLEEFDVKSAVVITDPKTRGRVQCHERGDPGVRDRDLCERGIVADAGNGDAERGADGSEL